MLLRRVLTVQEMKFFAEVVSSGYCVQERCLCFPEKFGFSRSSDILGWCIRGRFPFSKLKSRIVKSELSRSLAASDWLSWERASRVEKFLSPRVYYCDPGKLDCCCKSIFRSKLLKAKLLGLKESEAADLG